MKILLVGQAPGEGKVGREPWIHTRSGQRIARMLDVPVDRLLEVIDGDNVVTDAAEPRRARDPQLGAEVLERWPHSKIVVAAGQIVARALGCTHRDLPLMTWHPCRTRDGQVRLLAVMPHPSGASRWWNDRDNRRRARRWLHRAVHEDGWAVGLDTAGHRP